MGEQAVGTTQIENDRTRVTEWRFAPGAATGYHRHEYDYVVVPTTSDSKLTLWAGRSIYRELIEAGVRIHEYQGGMLHGKLAIVDDQWCTAGSANLDCRSFRLAFEVNCFLYDRKASRSLAALFDSYRAKSVQVTDAMQYDRKLGHRLVCGAARLTSPLL